MQSGWLRASHRAPVYADPADDPDFGELRAMVTHAEVDAAPLVEGEAVPVRVEIMPFAHVFRAGSRLRLPPAVKGWSQPGAVCAGLGPVE